MRLSAKNVYAKVGTVPESDRLPVRLQIGGNVYRLDADEAIILATRLADTVAELRTNERTPA